MSNQLKEQTVKASAAEEAVDIEDLARRFKAGEEGAFDELVTALQSRVFNFAYRMLHNYEDATEITQDVFVKVHKVIDKFRGQSKFSTWLFAIAANMCRNRIRKTKRIASHEVTSMDQDDYDRDPDLGPDGRPEDPSRHSQSREVFEMVRRCVASLPVDFRSVMVLRDLQGLSYEEIAETLGCSLGTVKSRLSRARSLVRAQLERAGVTV